MRILVSGLSGEKLAGIETFLFNMNHFMSDDVIFDYVIEGQETIHEETIRAAGGKVFFVAPKRQILRSFLGWCRVLRQNKGHADAVYFNTYSLAWFLPLLAARLYGYRVILHAHNCDFHDCGMLQKLAHNFNRCLQKHIRMTRLTNSKLSSRFFFGNTPAEMIYCAIEPEQFTYRDDIRRKMRAELGLEGKHVYGFVGRISYQKNPLFLMDVFREIARLDETAAFLVCGEGELMEEMTQRAREYGLPVCFTGFVPNVCDYYQAMDEFVFPSRFEGLGIVLVEAQTAGLPCIASAQVIPEEAKLSDLLEFVLLENGAWLWAQRAVDLLARHEGADRAAAVSVTAGTRFNIHTEAAVLEHALRRTDA